jgi:hypothetical protein
MGQQRKQVYINKAALQRVVSAVVDEMARTIEGPVQGENAYTFGLGCSRQALYTAVEQAQERGEEQVLNLLVDDWISIPLFNAASDEPGWYLTISLNASIGQLKRERRRIHE